MATKRFSMISLLILAVFSLSGCDCGPPDGSENDAGNPPGTTPANDMVACGDLEGNYVTVYGTWSFVPVGNTYGTNTFAVWEVEEVADAGTDRYVSTGEPVTTSLPAKDWKVPPPDWGAIRLALDGLDPHYFTAQDPFYLLYLPYVPGTSWQSWSGATNDGKCPGSDQIVNGRHTCIQRNQLDGQARPFTHGKRYLFRLAMFIPLGSNDHNRLQSCYQTIKTY